ncbi:hypothetical protein Alsa2_CDS0108 [Staphylococcus phage Alsa_2]|nr:hypothetical protein Alsa2_CDS0108 [Staphylococcus phage Alsa_2]
MLIQILLSTLFDYLTTPYYLYTYTYTPIHSYIHSKYPYSLLIPYPYYPT